MTFALVLVAIMARNEPAEVMSTLIVSLGGFCAGVAFVKALWRLSPWLYLSRRHRRRFDLFFGVLLLSFAGLALLTTDHIYQHLVDDNTPLWQLWLALLSFVAGAVALVGILTARTTTMTRSSDP